MERYWIVDNMNDDVVEGPFDSDDEAYMRSCELVAEQDDYSEGPDPYAYAGEKDYDIIPQSQIPPEKIRQWEEENGPIESAGDYGLGDEPISEAGPESEPEFQVYMQDVWDYAQSRYSIPPERMNTVRFENAVQQAFDGGVEAMEFVDGFFGYMGEATGERASKLATKSKKYDAGDSPRGKARHGKFQSTAEPGQEEFDFSEPDPEEEMFFGSKTGEDFVGTMIDPKTTDQEFKGQHVNVFDDDEGFTDDEEEAGFGGYDRAIDPEDVGSVWGPEGHQEPPGADIQFPGDIDPEEEPSFFEPRGYWGRKQRKLYRPPEDTSRKGAGDDLKWHDDIKMWQKDEAMDPNRVAQGYGELSDKRKIEKIDQIIADLKQLQTQLAADGWPPGKHDEIIAALEDERAEVASRIGRR